MIVDVEYLPGTVDLVRPAHAKVLICAIGEGSLKLLLIVRASWVVLASDLVVIDTRLFEIAALFILKAIVVCIMCIGIVICLVIVTLVLIYLRSWSVWTPRPLGKIFLAVIQLVMLFHKLSKKECQISYDSE